MEDAGGWASGPSLRAEGETGNRSRLPMAGAHVSRDRGSKGHLISDMAGSRQPKLTNTRSPAIVSGRVRS